MIPIAEKTENIGCNISKEEYNRMQVNIRKYGFKGISDYIRSALEFFDARRYNASKQSEVNIIQDCIDLLNDHQKHIVNQMMQESLKNIDENLEESASIETQNFEGSDEKPSKNFEELEDKTFKEFDENLEGSNSTKTEKTIEPFENVIQTLIRITASKGKPTKEDFTFQAQRCGKTASYVRQYYEDNYEFFVRESDKYG